MEEQSVLLINMLDAGEIDRNKDLSDQIIMAERLGQSISVSRAEKLPVWSEPTELSLLLHTKFQ